MRLTRQEQTTIDIFALGARDVNGLSDAQVHIQPH